MAAQTQPQALMDLPPPPSPQPPSATMARLLPPPVEQSQTMCALQGRFPTAELFRIT